jgi:hypothetical protein
MVERQLESTPACATLAAIAAPTPVPPTGTMATLSASRMASFSRRWRKALRWPHPWPAPLTEAHPMPGGNLPRACPRCDAPGRRERTVGGGGARVGEGSAAGADENRRHRDDRPTAVKTCRHGLSMYSHIQKHMLGSDSLLVEHVAPPLPYRLDEWDRTGPCPVHRLDIGGEQSERRCQPVGRLVRSRPMWHTRRMSPLATNR